MSIFNIVGKLLRILGRYYESPLKEKAAFQILIYFQNLAAFPLLENCKEIEEKSSYRNLSAWDSITKSKPAVS